MAQKDQQKTGQSSQQPGQKPEQVRVGSGRRTTLRRTIRKRPKRAVIVRSATWGARH